jgi:hypothetical protein
MGKSSLVLHFNLVSDLPANASFDELTYLTGSVWCAGQADEPLCNARSILDSSERIVSLKESEKSSVRKL